MMLVGQIQHGIERAIGSSGFDVLAGACRSGLQVHDRNAVDDRKGAAVAAEDGVADVVADDPVERGGDDLESSPAERTAQQAERGMQHGRSGGRREVFQDVSADR